MKLSRAFVAVGLVAHPLKIAPSFVAVTVKSTLSPAANSSDVMLDSPPFAS